MSTAPAASTVDHLVVLAASLADGVAWCETTLGITPGPGGAHPLMGTHNRLFRLVSAAFPACYGEIIAVDPEADPPRAGTRRWFDMDDADLQRSLRRDGPRLAHFVARTADIDAACRALAAQGIDRGPPLAASRQTPQGLLEWKITVRPDGRRLVDGLLPTLIEWGDTHPTDAMPPSGLQLEALVAQHPDGALLQAAHGAIGLRGVDLAAGPAALRARLRTPRGVVELSSSVGH